MEKTTNILLTDGQIKEMIFACRERSNDCYKEFIGCLRYCTNEEIIYTARYFRNEMVKYEELISLLDNSESINPWTSTDEYKTAFSRYKRFCNQYHIDLDGKED